jgi:hypothetical protein
MVSINICISAAIVLAERITRISNIFGDKILNCISFNVQEALKAIEYLVSLWKVPLVLSNAMVTAILHSEVRNLSYGNPASSAAHLSSSAPFRLTVRYDTRIKVQLQG